jgi:hypothetical protein
MFWPASIFAPMAQHAVLRSRRGMVGGGRDELTATEKLERRLDRALRQAGVIGKRTQAGLDWLPLAARGLAVEKKVNQIRRRLAIVPDDIAQQDIENVIVDRDRFAETRHDEK